VVHQSFSNELRPGKELFDKLNAGIAHYEQMFKMSTETMQEKVVNGSLKETDEICQWLQLSAVRSYLLLRRNLQNESHKNNEAQQGGQ